MLSARITGPSGRDSRSDVRRSLGAEVIPLIGLIAGAVVGYAAGNRSGWPLTGLVVGLFVGYLIGFAVVIVPAFLGGTVR